MVTAVSYNMDFGTGSIVSSLEVQVVEDDDDDLLRGSISRSYYIKVNRVGSGKLLEKANGPLTD